MSTGNKLNFPPKITHHYVSSGGGYFKSIDEIIALLKSGELDYVSIKPLLSMLENTKLMGMELVGVLPNEKENDQS